MPENDIDIMARTIWGEARGEPDPGMAAVAWVIWNRVRHPRWWGRDIDAVCTTPRQFSCWNKNDPNRPKLLAVDEQDGVYVKALAISSHVIAGTLPDPTAGATSYFDRRMPEWPDWAKGRQPVATIGHHIFFRDE